MILKSMYKDGGHIPSKFANIGISGGQNISPPFEWTEAPAETESFVLVMVDHHPVANDFIHWVVVDIPPDVTALEQGASGTDKMPPGSRELSTTYGTPRYGGPRPPARSGDHEYATYIFALNVPKLELPDQPTYYQCQQAVRNKTLATGKLSGFFGQ